MINTDKALSEQYSLKPCPFCGVIPKLWCDITDWLGKPVYKGENRPIKYELEAEHKSGCFIRHMNGTNAKGRDTAFNWQVLLTTWNRRYEK